MRASSIRRGTTITFCFIPSSRGRDSLSSLERAQKPRPCVKIVQISSKKSGIVGGTGLWCVRFCTWRLGDKRILRPGEVLLRDGVGNWGCGQRGICEESGGRRGGNCHTGDGAAR